MADLKLKQLEDQLKRIGCNFRFWGRAELKELAEVLLPGETVMNCVNGQYEGGFAMLAATDQRVLLIDKKPMYLTLEDIRFDMIAEVDYNHRMLNANIFICTPNKSLRFIAYNRPHLRKLFQFVQQRVMEIRQHYQHQAESLQKVMDGATAQPAPDQQPQQQLAPQQFAYAPAPGAAPAYDVQYQPAPPPTVTQAAPTPVAHPLAYKTMAPIISAYTRLPMMSRQRRFLGSRAMNTPMPSSIYPQQS